MRLEDTNTLPNSRFEELPEDPVTKEEEQRQPSRRDIRILHLILHLTNPPPPQPERVVSAPDRTQEPKSNESDFTNDNATAGDRVNKARETKPLESKTTRPEAPKDKQALVQDHRDHDHDPAGPYVCW